MLIERAITTDTRKEIWRITFCCKGMLNALLGSEPKMNLISGSDPPLSRLRSDNFGIVLFCPYCGDEVKTVARTPEEIKGGN